MKIKPTIAGLILLFFIMISSLHCKKDSQPEPVPSAKPGLVKGKVSNEYNQLLPGAVLTLKRNGNNTYLTSYYGHYFFDSLQAGSYTLSVNKDGYIESSASVSITAGDTAIQDFTLKAGTAFLNVLSDTVITIKPYATTFIVKVASNTSWTTSTEGSWITAAKTSSNGNDSIIVAVAASTSDTVRQTNLVLQAGSIIKTIHVIQLMEVKLKQVIPLPGNKAKSEIDSIALLFNQPVTVQSIFPGVTYCQSGINYSYEGNKVTFSYACAALGGDYPFTITTNSASGDQYTFSFSAGFYGKAINLTGTIQSYFVNDADNSYWVITDHPNALYKIDMSSFEILHKYDLLEEPVMFTVNPYNNKIYIAYRRIPKLYILNQNGTTDKVLNIPHDTTRGIYEPNGPYVYPYKLAFTKSGKGMIWLGDVSGNYYPIFWFIDAAANHRIWYESIIGNESSYLQGKANYDKSKLILTTLNDDPTISTFDPGNMTISNYKPHKYTRGVFLQPSRKNDNVYSGQLYNQLIINPTTGFESLESYIDNRSGGNADFCYESGKEQTIYFTQEGSIEALDYTNRTSPVLYDAILFLQGTTATLDGRHVILYRHDGNYNAKIIQLPAGWFSY